MIMRRGASQLVLWESLGWGRRRGGLRAVIIHFLRSAGRPSDALVIHSAAWLWPLRGLRAGGCLLSVPGVGHLLFHLPVKIICNLLFYFFYLAFGCASAALTSVWTQIEKRLFAACSRGTIWRSWIPPGNGVLFAFSQVMWLWSLFDITWVLYKHFTNKSAAVCYH